MTAAKHIERTGRTLDVHRLTPGSLYTLGGCVTLCRSCHGHQPRSPRGATDNAHPSVQIRIRKSVTRRVRRIAAHLGKDPGEYIAERLALHLDKDEAKMLSDIRRESEQSQN